MIYYVSIPSQGFNQRKGRVFPKVDHFDNDARIVLEENKFSKKQ